jgi:hypothetical protein
MCLMSSAGFFDAAVPDAAAAQKITFTRDFEYAGRHAYYFVALEKPRGRPGRGDRPRQGA